MPNKRRIARVATGTANSPANQIHPPVPPVRLRIYGVRDPELAFGGRLVPDLTEFKREIMTTKTTNEWTLVLAIHGSANRLAAQLPGMPNHDVYYNANKIDFIFSDVWRPIRAPLISAAKAGSLVGQEWWDELFEPEDELRPRDLPAIIAVQKLAGPEGWDEWRKTYGPTHLVLIACQVTKTFEETLISHFIRPGFVQEALGLGTGRKPLTDAIPIKDFRKKDVITRKEYLRLPQEERDWIREKLHELNAEFGYYGGPPVPDEQILEYYFDIDPKGKWVKVTVGREVEAHGHKDLVDTGIPFWNRPEASQ